MSRRGLARHNAKRDGNEPELRKRFAYHGWHTEQVSGKGMPDLMVWPDSPREREAVRAINHGAVRNYLVDVKMPKGKLKPAQEEKWKALHAKGIPVYVVRTEADVDALIKGTLEPWRPMGMGHAIRAQEYVPVKGKLKPSANSSDKTQRDPPVTIRTRLGPTVRKPSPNYTAPRGSRTWPLATTAVVPSAEAGAVARAVLAAQEAGETFAPPACTPSSPCGHCMGCIGTLP